MWKPSTIGQYAGICISIVVLAIVFRSLLALRAIRERKQLDAKLNLRYVVVSGRMPLEESPLGDNNSTKVVLSANGVEEDVIVVKKKPKDVRPWRISTDTPRALLDTTIAGVGYLLYVS